MHHRDAGLDGDVRPPEKKVVIVFLDIGAILTFSVSGFIRGPVVRAGRRHQRVSNTARGGDWSEVVLLQS